MQNDTLITAQLVRGALALAVMVGAVLLANDVWAVVPLIIVAIVLMRGCPMCWLSGLFEALSTHRAHDRADAGHRPHLGQ